MKARLRNKGKSWLAGAGFLLALSAVAGWPVLSGGGLWYLDHPAHLAETLERARPGWSGWSDLAFCGFPLGQWHSPVAYGALGELVRLGMPWGFSYVAALWASFAFPPLVLFSGVRERTGAGRAALLASLLMLQPSALVGIESAWGGMWTFHLAAGGLLWLMQRWSAGRDGVAGNAALIGAMGLTHLFVLAVVPLLAVLKILFSPRRKTVVAVLGACILGALASAAYWIPPALARAGGGWTPQNLSPLRILWALAVPADLQSLTSAATIEWREWMQPGVLSLWALIGLGVAGALRSADAGPSRPARFGLAFGGAALAVLLLLPMLPMGLDRIWGPASWRLLYVVRLGLAWSAAGVFASRRAGEESPMPLGVRGAVAGLLLLGLGGWIAAPLRHAVRDPGGQTRKEVYALWNAIRSTANSEEHGRIYLQDTYRNPELPPGLARHSHVLALTAAATGVRQLGAYYGMAPQRTAEWTSGEFGRICGVAPDDPDAASSVLERLRRGHCTRLVVASPAWAGLLEGHDGFIREYRSDWFTLFRLAGESRGGVEILSGDLSASVEYPHAGETILDVSSSVPGGALRLAQAWHPDWTPDVAAGVSLASDETGLLRMDNVPAGRRSWVLRYRPPAWPRWVSRGAWALIVVAGLHGKTAIRRKFRE
ncbi:MAG: hypothetical protein AB7V14_02680 [Kiritimatiellia bacterium]